MEGKQLVTNDVAETKNGGVRDRVVDSYPILAARNNASLAQQLEMLRDVSLPHPCGLDNARNIQLTGFEAADNLQAADLAEDFEVLGNTR